MTPLEQAMAERAMRQARAEQARRQSQSQGAALPEAMPSQPITPQTNMVEQSMSGFNEGLAGIIGMPVDLMTGAINMGTQGINNLAGTEIPEIEAPRGGSEHLKSGLFAPTISETQPQTTAQRYGRRVGQEVGASSVPGGAMLAKAKSPLKLAGLELASATGAGVAGQTAREVAPESNTADIIASMVGGIAPIGASVAMRARPQAPTMADLRKQQASAYDAVDQSQARLTEPHRDGLVNSLQQRTDGMEMDQFMHPKASRTMERMQALEAQPRIADVEKKRRLISRDVAGSLDPSESAIGSSMKDEIDTYLAQVADDGNLGSEGAQALEKLQEGRALTQRIKKSELLEQAVTKAERRAATSGTGGNEVNTTRQNIRALLDNPKKSRGFSAAEREQMEAIVRGTPAQNALRLAGRMSPTSGTLPAMAGMGSGAAFGPLGAIPSAAGLVAKGGSEALTKKSIAELMATVRNGGPLPKGESPRDAIAALIASVMAQSSSVEP